MQMLVCIEQETNPIDVLITRPQFRITNIREYDVVDKWVDKIKNLFNRNKVYITPTVFDIRINEQLGILSVIPGKKVQEVIWRQAKTALDKTPPCNKITSRLVEV